ncbi:MAG: cytochrome c biogenesis protein CcsA [Candidatus Hydrogenedentes bacterium]|nr:cytochrome c biogenesis protein CcsA [Candidatus Hydrogenedentota bacterium]
MIIATGLSRRLSVGGALLLALVFALRWVHWGRLPLTTLMDVLDLIVVLSTIVMLAVYRDESAQALQCFFAPPLALLAAISGCVAPGYLYAEPRSLQGVYLAVHVGLAFLAYSMFLAASLTSAGYIFKAQQLKSRRPTRLFSQLPALEQLDQKLFFLIRTGYPMFAITLFIGLLWAWHERDLLGPRWWLSPKIFLSFIMAGFYSVSFHTRRFGLLRGRQLAYLVFVGFSVLLAAFLALGLFDVINYNFWGSAQ